MSEAGGEPFAVELAPAALRELRRLDALTVARLRIPILALGATPRPAGAVRLHGTDFWRIRAGDVRVIYAIDDERGVIIVLRIARRNERTYRRLR
jgi:mRNA interferase RelE/StbE